MEVKCTITVIQDAAAQRLYEDATDGRDHGRMKRPVFLVQNKILGKFFEYPVLDSVMSEVVLC